MKRCAVSVFPLRATPEHKSEMVSQILYGEGFEVLETRESWEKIRLDFDGYEGWVDNIPYTESLEEDIHCVVVPFVEKDRLILPMGAELSAVRGEAGGIIATAMSLLQVPYLWGGRTFMGMDCSGFTQVVFKANGIRLPRDASQQVNIGEEVGFLGRQPGDLAYFTAKDGRVTHVGIVLEGDKIIHASRSVHIDTLKAEGIIDESGRKTHDLFRIMRPDPKS